MRALFAALLLFAATTAASAQEEVWTVLAANYADPVTRYGHDALGPGHEWGVLEVTVQPGKKRAKKEVRRFVLPHERVFEDIAPRLADLDGDGVPEVIVVESHLDFGSRLAIYDANGPVTATDWIGQNHRWLAPVGAVDIDRDGKVEVALIDRPHLNKSLAIYRYSNRSLDYVLEIAPFTNHRFGDDYIVGGARTCKGVPAFIVADGDYKQVLAVTWAGKTPHVTSLGPVKGPESFERALACKKL